MGAAHTGQAARGPGSPSRPRGILARHRDLALPVSPAGRSLADRRGLAHRSDLAARPEPAECPGLARPLSRRGLLTCRRTSAHRSGIRDHHKTQDRGGPVPRRRTPDRGGPLSSHRTSSRNGPPARRALGRAGSSSARSGSP